MNYEIINLDEKIIVGTSVTTSNMDSEMGAKIGQLWSDFYENGISSKIKNKLNDYAIGLYSDYTNDGYTVTVGNEVSQYDNKDFLVKVIKAGKYAKFSIYGHVQKDVAKAWETIWKMDLDRSFTGDFEEYLDSNFENAHIDIYIALN